MAKMTPNTVRVESLEQVVRENGLISWRVTLVGEGVPYTEMETLRYLMHCQQTGETVRVTVEEE